MLLSSTALVACLFLSSCTKTPTTASIVGKWKFNKEIAQLIMDGKVIEEEVLYGASLNGLDMYFEFMSDNTFN